MSSGDSDSNSITSLKDIDGGDTNSLNQPVSRIKTTGDGDEFVIIGNKKYYRHELMQAFGGTFDVGLHPPPKLQIGNPSPLGLCAFSITTLVMSLYGLNVKDIHNSNVVVGMAIFYAGTMQTLAGIWEFFVGNTFATTTMISYGSFFLSYGALYIPSFGIMKAYATVDPTLKELQNAIGFFLIAWAIFSFFMLLCTMKSVISLFAMFVFIFFTFFLQGIGFLLEHHGLIKAGNAFGILVTATGLFNAWAGVATTTNSYFVIPITWLSRHHGK
ncbi:acetate transporter, putative [Candida dubliniensis CD36]|uniref:Acetate transporter, putative n=1 Tax=Candida dubliniensis (strain CD36 / ATCC MYA-646 / CBS 7987 / NCPF 3949 / NRRL Y-17841) TaxID=573826 RepID=B9WKT2_CANDC|nr:acetate transporter, putative [Candida dubliniensis CD36]CAX39632.1 acetate transporter, putative [Candida dubliniensis CD36]